jgi:putative flippase GtrA
VDWGVFAVFYEIVGTTPRTAQIAAQFLAIINSYIINKNWTFKSNAIYAKCLSPARLLL